MIPKPPTPPSGTYQRRRPELTSLHRAVTEHLPGLNARLSEEGQPLPGFVNQTFSRYLGCGQLKQGSPRVKGHTSSHVSL